MAAEPLTNSEETPTDLEIEGRRWPRYSPAPGVYAWVLVETLGLTWQADVLNLSPGGIALALAERLERGTRVTVKLYNPRSRRWFKPEMQVAEVVERGGGYFRVSGTFLQELGENDLRGLVWPPNADT